MSAYVDTILQLLEMQGKKDGISDEEKGDIYRLRDLIVRSVHLVDRGANGRRFVVVKRSEDMPNENEGLGPQVVENDDGTLSTVEAEMDEQLEKAEVALSPAGKAAMVKALTEAQERLMSLLNKVKGASEKEGASTPPEIMSEGKAIAALVGKACGGYPYPYPKASQKADDDEDDAKKAKGKTKNDDEMEKGEVKDYPLELDGIKISGPLAEVAKAGAKMSGARLAKFKELVSGLQKMLDDLSPQQQDQATKLIDAAFGKLTKRAEAQEGLLAELLNVMKGIASSGSPVPAGQATTEESQANVAKRDKEDQHDRSWIGLDLNNKELFKRSADDDTYFG